MDYENLVSSLRRLFGSQYGMGELIAMSRHGSGYKRENAIRRLGMLGNPNALPCLLVRANDWVPQVRSAAREAIRMLMVEGNAKAFILCLPELYHLQECGRDNHDHLIAEVNSYLLKSENREQLIDALDSDLPYIARYAMRLCIDNALLPISQLAKKCIEHKDVVIKSYGAQLLHELSGVELKNLLALAIQDGFMPLRREAYIISLRNKPEENEYLLEAMLLDRNISIREIAIYRMKDNKGLYENYLVNILHGKNSTISEKRYSILAMGELGVTSAIDDIVRLLNSDFPGIKKSSLQALSRLEGENAEKWLVAALGDESPGVAKLAAYLINRTGIRVSLSSLLDAALNDESNHVFFICLGLSRSINKWDRLVFILTLMDRYGEMQEHLQPLQYSLKQWDYDFNRTNVQPSQSQLNCVGDLASKCYSYLEEERTKSLAFTLSSYGLKIEGTVSKYITG